MVRSSVTIINDGLSQYTESIFIPFVHKFSSKEVPQVLCTIEGIDIRMPVDTGSTSLIVGAPILPNISATAGTPAHHYFTSSRILYIGRLVELPIYFHGEGCSYATAIVPVLIVDKSWSCPWYDPTNDGFTCPPGPRGETAVERETSNITYMGVGFGRNQPRDGMPNGTPRANPFLNINAINGLPISNLSSRAGYVVCAEGVHLGLTRENTRGFAFEYLEPGLAHDEDFRDWAMARMSFSINGEGNNRGPVLIDTGIPQMYIRTEEGVSLPTVIIRNPNKRGHAKLVKRVKPGTGISVSLPSLDTPVVSYSFIVGEGSYIEPRYVIPAKHAGVAFINTGRNFLFGYSIAFDAIGGRFGVRPVRTPSSPSTL